MIEFRNYYFAIPNEIGDVGNGHEESSHFKCKVDGEF